MWLVVKWPTLSHGGWRNEVVSWEEIKPKRVGKKCKMAEALIDRILADIKAAMKTRDMAALTALRGLHSQIKDATVNAGKEITDEAVLACVSKGIKQREESIELYNKGNRPELAAKEKAEMDLFRKYQPQQMTKEEIEAVVKATIAETGAKTKKEIGKVMGALMPKVKGKADGRLVNQVVQSLLA